MTHRQTRRERLAEERAAHERFTQEFLSEFKEDSPELIAAKHELRAIQKPAPFFADQMKVRIWIYNLALAGLAIFTTFTSIEAITMEQWTELLTALLGFTAVAAPLTIARANVK